MSHDPPSRVGLIGVGLMGSAIAARLAGAGLGVLAYDVRPEPLRGLAGAGAAVAPDIAAIARSCAQAVIAVFDTPQVEAVVEGPGGLLTVAARDRRIRHVINTATCDPDRIAALGQRAAAQGLAFVELPVSGTSQQLAQGEGYGLVGGEEAAAEACAAVIGAICPRSVHMGALGNGTRAKLAINHILGLNRAALAEGLVLADRLGLPLATFLDAAKASAAYSQIMDVKGQKMIARDFAPHGKVAQSLKDFELILAQAAARGQSLPLAEVYAELMAGCVAAGEGEWDNAAVIAEIDRRRSGKP